MPKFTQVDEREWIHEDVVGHAIDRCKLWYDGHGLSFSLVKMPANYELSLHRHETWVAVFVVEGSMKWEGDGQERKLGTGDFYFVHPGEEHVETSLDETLVLIIKAEPNIQYPVDADSDRR
ncbi:cupin domain-containing protein [Streptomyces sp. Li-HN-5-11]|jgi:quercetin dioxygenase-like cupin family protein|uniref:cupin domain-containing protein n=1 Tax=Streptomyces sp. Li-HN-5-11 TaxID=3075432 RepID=UPI0028A942A5|nr:cupin domain-containing protein [Streptomyces sp. Li-HN-5-11]WNM31764.1 cupin domain-containing protein [Streptomyces sp. Li-HN-5-11]